MKLPKVLRVRQNYAIGPQVDIRSTVEAQMQRFAGQIRQSDRIAVGVGSRGITNLPLIVTSVLDELHRYGARPFLFPAMGSHGGATSQGQREVLATYGITESSMRVPILDSMEVIQVAVSSDGVPAYCSTDARASDGILLINRIKPHTDFFGTLGSGLTKMCVVGLGKRTGATAMHLAAMQYGYERVIRNLAKVVIQNAPVLGGIALVENQFHDTAKIEAVRVDEIESVENQLLVEAKLLMPRLPFEELDLLIVDQIGKNISGAGMDPNVINRSIHGYDSLPARGDRPAPFIRRIFVRNLTSKTQGNAIGIGMADAVTTRLVESMDTHATNINALTALTPQSAKIPIAFQTDREAIERLLASLPISAVSDAKVVRVLDTLSVAKMEISEALWNKNHATGQLIALSELSELNFDTDGNLTLCPD